MILQKSQNRQKSPPQVFSAICSIWGLAQKCLILIEWITYILTHTNLVKVIKIEEKKSNTGIFLFYITFQYYLPGDM